VFQSDCGYQIFKPNRDRVRYADGSFIRTGRLPNNEPPAGHCRIAPDLVIEAVSPNDTAPEVEQKVEEWLDAGVRLVWVIFPETQRIYVHRDDRTVSRLGTADELSGEKVLPGFKCRVATIFKIPRSKAGRAPKR
jgi:Uma2 family endonuclease